MTTHTRQGFTLVELMIYITIISIFLVSAIQFSVAVLQAGEKARIQTEVQQNARFAMERIRREIRTADDVNTGASTFGAHPGVLSLAHDDVVSDPTIFDVSSGALRIKQGTGSPTNLTSSRVEVTNFVVQNRSVAGRTRNIQIQLTLSWADEVATPFDTTISLQSSVVIREEED